MPSTPPINPAILLPLLRALRGGATLAELGAAAGGRSRSTVFRDLATLRGGGMRIECRRGRYVVLDWGIFDPDRAGARIVEAPQAQEA